MANYFIAVGGTGQNVALAYYRFAKLAGIEPAEIFVMDSDRSISGNQGDFKPIAPIPVEPCIREGQKKSFRSLVNPGGDPAIDAALSVLFTSEQMRTPIDKGMFGKPSIGASTIMDKIVLIEDDETPDRTRAGADPLFANLINNLGGTGQHRVVICGSAMGGTGAGGVPTLAQYIARNVDRSRVKIVILYFLKHFNLLTPPSGVESEKRITESQVRVNAESGMCYLRSEISRGVDACALFGLANPIEREWEKAQEQREQKIFLYLLAAILANNSFHADIKEIFNPPAPDKIYAYWIPDQGLRLSNIKVFFPAAEPVSLEHIAKLARATNECLKVFRSYLKPLPGLTFAPSLVVPRNLRILIDELRKRRGSSADRICEAMAERIRKFEDEMEGYLEWFEELLRTEDQLKTKDPLSSILYGRDEIRIHREDYRKMLDRPMGFIRKWVNATSWDKQGDFMRPLVTNVRSELKAAYLS
jgi:hypothetical protein